MRGGVVHEEVKPGVAVTFSDDPSRTVVRVVMDSDRWVTLESGPVWTVYCGRDSTVLDVGEPEEMLDPLFADAGIDVNVAEMLSLLRDSEWYLRVAQPLPGPLVSPLAEGEKMIEDEHGFWIRVEADALVPPGARVVPAEEVINFTADTDPGF